MGINIMCMGCGKFFSPTKQEDCSPFCPICKRHKRAMEEKEIEMDLEAASAAKGE